MFAEDDKATRDNSGTGRGNFGNPEQHRDAGKQSHKND